MSGQQKESFDYMAAHTTRDVTDILNLLDSMEDFDEDDLEDAVPASRPEEVDSGAVEEITALLSAALAVYAFDRDRESLHESLKTLCSMAAALPEEEIIASIGKTSPLVDILLPFALADARQGLPGPALPGLSCAGGDVLSSLFEGKMDKSKKIPSVPFLAFLLAGAESVLSKKVRAVIERELGANAALLSGKSQGKEGE